MSLMLSEAAKQAMIDAIQDPTIDEPMLMAWQKQHPDWILMHAPAKSSGVMIKHRYIPNLEKFIHIDRFMPMAREAYMASQGVRDPGAASEFSELYRKFGVLSGIPETFGNPPPVFGMDMAMRLNRAEEDAIAARMGSKSPFCEIIEKEQNQKLLLLL